MLRLPNRLYAFQIFCLPLPANISKIMEEAKKTSHGGSRPGAGRPPKEDSKKQIALKLDRDLYDVFYSEQFTDNKGRYINDSIRATMKKDGYIE